MSEPELHLIRSRLDGGLRNKAERSELRQYLPVGLDRVDDGRVILCADEQVRHAIERVFCLWHRLGSARQGVSELIAEGQQLPRRTVGERRIAGAGRAMRRSTTSSPTPPMPERSSSAAPARRSASTSRAASARGSESCRSASGPSACPSSIRAICPRRRYLATRERLRRNVRPRGEGGGAAREGHALLQGLVRCGRCGRRMQVAYSGTAAASPAMPACAPITSTGPSAPASHLAG